MRHCPFIAAATVAHVRHHHKSPSPSNTNAGHERPGHIPLGRCAKPLTCWSPPQNTSNSANERRQSITRYRCPTVFNKVSNGHSRMRRPAARLRSPLPARRPPPPSMTEDISFRTRPFTPWPNSPLLTRRPLSRQPECRGINAADRFPRDGTATLGWREASDVFSSGELGTA